jgi:hypothetical protein
MDLLELNIFAFEIDKLPSGRYFATERSLAKVIEYPDPQASKFVLKIASQVAKFNVVKIAEEGEDVYHTNRDDDDDEEEPLATSGDSWCIGIPHSHPFPCEHKAVGWMFADVGWFQTNSKTSIEIEKINRRREFLLLTHWREQLKDEKGNWLLCDWNHLLGKYRGGIGNAVLAFLILRNNNGTACRVSLVPIPHEIWVSGSPEEAVVDLV